MSLRAAAQRLALLALALPLLLSLLHSPAPASADSSCPAGHYCYNEAFTVDAVINCTASQYCPGNVTARLCARGHYCPTVAEELECPSGNYCPPGTVLPRPCSGLASCPAGSERYMHWGSLLLLAVLLPGLALMPKVYDRYNGWARRKARSATGGSGGATKQPLSPSPSPSPEPGQNGTAAATPILDNVPRMEIEFNNVAASIAINGTRKPILADVTGHFRAGRLIAVMGPSGAGKSSLIAVLTGQVPATSGRIETRIEGALEPDLRRARRLGMIGVVPQADTMIPCLTPRDILTHSAFTRLPSSWSAARKIDRVEHTLRALQLERVQHTPVGDEDVRGVSGGEKKRTNIGIELVNSPSLLILDEPTTGLDATSSNGLVDTLKAITALQTTVVAVLHQPRQEIFSKLDDLLLLAPGGRTVYFGEARLTLEYFEAIGYECDGNTNPSDFFIDVIAGKAGPPQINPAGGGVGGGGGAPKARLSRFGEQEFKEAGTDAAAAGAGAPTTPADIQSYLAEQWRSESGAGAKFRAANGMAQTGAAIKVASATGVDSSSNGGGGGVVARFQSDISLPSFPTLTYLYAYRGLLQCARSVPTIQLELFMHILAGAVIGMAFVSDNWFLPPIPRDYIRFCPEPMRRSCEQDAVRDVLDLMATYTVMAVGLVAAIIANRNYGQELNNISRESSAGLSLVSYFLGKALAELPLMVMYSFLYCVAYWCIASPASEFGDFYLVLLLFEFVLFGIGYVSTFLFRGENALLCSAISALLGGLATNNDGFIKSLCWARWAAEALFISEARLDQLTPPVDQTVRSYIENRSKFDTDNFGNDCLALIIMGVVLRLMAFGLMFLKYKQ